MSTAPDRATPTEAAEEALARFLRRLTLRSELGETGRQAILGLPGELLAVPAGRDFVSVGQSVSHSCLIVDGLAARFAQLRDGQRSIVAFHLPGEMADLHSVVARNVTWALQAVTPTRILKIPHAALRGLTVDYPAIAMAFWRDCVVDGNILAQWMVNMARKDSVARLAHLLCEMAVRYRAIGLGGRDHFPFPITQASLADALGLTPIHLNRVLMRLKEEGMASKESGTVVIRDAARLAATGEFDSAYLQFDGGAEPLNFG